MIVPANKNLICMLWSTVVLSSVLALPEFGFTLTMPTNSAEMFGDRAKRSPPAMCVEIKPNGPLEEPYYICKGTDYTPFPKLTGGGNMASANYESAAAAREGSVQQGAVNSAQKNYNEVVYRDGGDRRVNFQDYHGGKSLVETQTSFNQQNKHTGLTESANTQHSKFTAGSSAKTFREQTPTGAFFQKSNDQSQPHFTAAYPHQFHPIAHHQHQHQFQQQAQHQQFQQNQKNFASQPATSYQLSFQRPEQFFRPVSNEKLDGYDSIYSDDRSRANPTIQHDGFKPPTPYSTQYNSGFSAHPPPAFQTVSTSAGSFGLPHAQHGSTNCKENCEKSVPQATASSGFTQNGVNQYAPKFGFGSQSSQPFSTGDGSSQLVYAHPPISDASSKTNVENTATIPSAYYSPSNYGGTSSFRFRDNAAAAFSTHNRSPVSNLGPHHTPPPESTVLGVPSNAAFYPSETSYPDGLPSARRSQSVHSHQVEGHQNRHSHPFHPENPQAPPQTVPSVQRHRSMIDDEVLRMPNWGFSTDELDLYRSMSSEEDDAKSKFIGAPLLALAPRRIIPLEHLEDPVMRTFYSSLDDVGPLPSFSSAYPPNQAFINPPIRNIPYRSPQQSCSQPPAPQFFNYNPCPPQREYTFQPIFIALPCYGQSIFPTLGSPYPATVTGNTMTPSSISTQSEVAHQTTSITTETQKVHVGSANLDSSSFTTKTENAAVLGSSHNVQKGNNPNFATNTTLATTTKDDTNQSSESVENSTPISTKTNQPNAKNDTVTASPAVKIESSENPKVIKFNKKVQDAIRNTTITPSLSNERVGASTTIKPTPAGSVKGQRKSEMSTTYRSLILHARKLAQMVNTNVEDDYWGVNSTPKPGSKKIRDATRSLANDNSSE